MMGKERLCEKGITMEALSLKGKVKWQENLEPSAVWDTCVLVCPTQDAFKAID